MVAANLFAALRSIGIGERSRDGVIQKVISGGYVELRCVRQPNDPELGEILQSDR